MISLSPRPVGRTLGTVSFASTLYLFPILDLLLAEIPASFREEVRLGLQEALVNAAKHGNNLDPNKTVLVRFSVIDDQYWWSISDQGSGFSPPNCCGIDPLDHLPTDERECGRGLYILHQIFDQVVWNEEGTELRLCKQIKNLVRLPLLR